MAHTLPVARRSFVVVLALALAMGLPPGRMPSADATHPAGEAIEQQFDVLAAPRYGVTTSTDVIVERGDLNVNWDPAPTATLEVVAKVTGATGGGGWRVRLNGVESQGVWFGASDSSFVTKSVAVPLNTNLSFLRLEPFVNGLGATGVLDITKAYVRLKQEGTIKKTTGRVPMAPPQQVVGYYTWVDAIDATLYTHDASVFDPQPSIRLRVGVPNVAGAATAEVRLVDETGTPVPGAWVDLNSASRGSYYSDPFALTSGKTYHVQLAATLFTWSLLSVDLQFEQATTDTHGIVKTAAWHPSVTSGVELTSTGNLNFAFPSPENTAEFAAVSWLTTIKRTSTGGSVRADLVTAGGTLVASGVSTTSGSYVALAAAVGSLPQASLDTKAVLAAGGQGRLAASVLRVAVRLRDTITTLTSSLAAISPNGDSTKDSTTVTASIDVAVPSPDWTLSITEPSGSEVRTFNGTGNSVSVLWNGKDSLGSVVPDETYLATLTISGLPNVAKSVAIIVDIVRPGIGAIAPRDNGNTMFTSQPIIASVSDVVPVATGTPIAGSGIDPGTLSVVVHDLTGSRPDQTFTPTLTNGVMRTSAASLDRGSTFQVTFTASDIAGNSSQGSTVFDVMQSAVTTVPTIAIASTLADGVTPGSTGDPNDLYTWQSAAVNVGSFTVSLNATRHKGDGAVDVTFNPQVAQVHYTVGGVPAFTAPEQTTAKTGGLFHIDQTGTVSVTTGSQTRQASTLTALVPKTADAGSVRLELATTPGTAAALAICSDPTEDLLCTPDPVTVNRREDLWQPWANLSSVDPYQLPQAVAPLVGLTLQPADPVCAGTQSPPSLADAVAHLGQALGTSDVLDPSVSLDPQLASALARLTDCAATYTALLLPSLGGPPTDAEQAGWLAGQRDLLTALNALGTVTAAAPPGCSILDPSPGLSLIELCDTQAQTHTADRAILVDQGGNDTYKNNAGGANGNEGSSGLPIRPVAVALDQAGADDYYDNTPTTGSFFDQPRIGGAMGNAIGILIDVAGNDEYGLGTGYDMSQGYGLQGAGYLMDLGGSDTYTAWGDAIGYGDNVGFGFVVDQLTPNTNETNTFRSYYGEGIGVGAGFQTLGHTVGLVIGSAGTDNYRAICPSSPTYCNSSSYTEIGQAIGSATPPDGGTAIGAVIDPGGADTYRCQKANSCLGVSVGWGAGLGLALDLGTNNDTYTIDAPSEKTLAYGWGGSGIVMNEGGGDQYNCYSKNCLGVGWLATGGLAPSAGEAIFLDVGAGADRYCYLNSTFLPYASTVNNPTNGNKPGRGAQTSMWVGEKDTQLNQSTQFGVGFDDAAGDLSTNWTRTSTTTCVS